jgi:hypothetical protein
MLISLICLNLQTYISIYYNALIKFTFFNGENMTKQEIIDFWVKTSDMDFDKELRQWLKNQIYK